MFPDFSAETLEQDLLKTQRWHHSYGLGKLTFSDTPANGARKI